MSNASTGYLELNQYGERTNFSLSLIALDRNGYGYEKIGYWSTDEGLEVVESVNQSGEFELFKPKEKAFDWKNIMVAVVLVSQ